MAERRLRGLLISFPWDYGDIGKQRLGTDVKNQACECDDGILQMTIPYKIFTNCEEGFPIERDVNIRLNLILFVAKLFSLKQDLSRSRSQ